MWGAPSRVFSCRSLVSARDVQDAVRLARNAPYGCAYGFSVNLCTREGHMTSLEVGPGKPEAQVHVHDVTRHDDPHSSRHYYHFNMYKHLKVMFVSCAGFACVRLRLVSLFLFLFVGCLSSPQQASVFQGRICSDNCACCHTEIEAVNQTCCLA